MEGGRGDSVWSWSDSSFLWNSLVLSVRDTHVQLLGKKLASKGMVWYFENHLLPAAGKTVSPQ